MVLTHLSETNNTPELALMSAHDGKSRACRPEVTLEAAKQTEPAAAVRM